MLKVVPYITHFSEEEIFSTTVLGFDLNTRTNSYPPALTRTQNAVRGHYAKI